MIKDYFNRKEAIGRLKHRVQFWRPMYTVNEFGEREKSYTAQDPVWANVEYKTTNSNEYVKDTRLTSLTNVQILIRHNPDINAEWRVVHKGVQMNIASVLVGQKETYTLLECIIDEPVDDYA